MIKNDIENLESLYESVLVTEAAHSKINKYGITDSSLINFIYRYERMLPWGQLKTEQDINDYISEVMVKSLLDRVDYDQKDTNPKTLYTTKINWKREIAAVKAQADEGNADAKATLDYYMANPEESRDFIMDNSNKTKMKSFDEWTNYITVINDKYVKHPAFQYIILSSIFTTTSNSTTVQLPALNKRTVESIYNQIDENPSETFNIANVYKSEAKESAIETLEHIETKEGTWIKIPSQRNDPDNFEDNVSKLMALACDTNWCIASESTATSYLRKGDFYILFIEDGDKQTGVAAVRMIGDNIEEIRGTYDDKQTLDMKYVDTVLDLVEKEQLTGGKEFVNDLKMKQEAGPVITKLNNDEFDLTEEELTSLRNYVNKNSDYNYTFILNDNTYWIAKTEYSWSAYELADALDLEKLKHYLAYLEDDPYFDMDIQLDDYQVDHLIDNLRPNDLQSIEQYARNEGWDEEIDSLTEYIMSGGSGLNNAFSRAVHRGYESGHYNEVYKAVKDTLGNMSDFVKVGGQYSDAYQIYLTSKDFWEYFKMYMNDEFSDIFDFIKYDKEPEDLDEPYYGFDDYDEEAAQEELQNEIHEL